MCAKWVQKSMDFHVENRENSIKQLFEKTGSFQHLFFIIFLSIWAWFWWVLARFWGHLAVQKKPKRAKFIFSIKLCFLLDLGRVGEGLGKVLGGFGDVQLVLLGLVGFAGLC